MIMLTCTLPIVLDQERKSYFNVKKNENWYYVDMQLLCRHATKFHVRDNHVVPFEHSYVALIN